jgi:hypothetical protein
MLSSIMVSNCPALHRINITSNSLQVCRCEEFGLFLYLVTYTRTSILMKRFHGHVEISIAEAGELNHIGIAMPIFARSGPHGL